MPMQSVVLPRKIIAGPDAIHSVPDLCEELGVRKKPFIVVDSNTRNICGDDLIDKLKGSRIGVIEDSTLSEVEKIKHEARGCSCIISAGGGKVIDVGKLAAAQLDTAFISVPTAPSHDGIASYIASINKNGVRESINARVPLAIVADTGIISNAPKRLIAAGCGDMLANITAVRDWKLAKARGERYSETAAGFSLLAAKVVMESAQDIASRNEHGINDLILALITSGASMSLYGSSRPASGSEHLFSHALDALGSKGVHGEQCGLGAIIFSYLQERNSKDPAIRTSHTWVKIKDILKIVGAPVTFREAGIDPKMAFQALVEAKNVRDRYTILNENPIMDVLAAEKLCLAAGIL